MQNSWKPFEKILIFILVILCLFDSTDNIVSLSFFHKSYTDQELQGLFLLQYYDTA